MDALRPLLARFARHPGPIERETLLQEELGIDSLSMIDVAVTIEDTFHVRVSDEAAETFRTIGDLVTYLTVRR